MNDILKGELVRLSALDAEEISRAFARWGCDSEFKRLLASHPQDPRGDELRRDIAALRSREAHP